MNCCGHFQKLMDAYASRGQLRRKLAASEAEVQRLRSRLAQVGVRDTGPEEQLPPDTRPGCVAQPCAGAALDGNLCAAHVADEVLP